MTSFQTNAGLRVSDRLASSLRWGCSLLVLGTLAASQAHAQMPADADAASAPAPAAAAVAASRSAPGGGTLSGVSLSNVKDGITTVTPSTAVAAPTATLLDVTPVDTTPPPQQAAAQPPAPVPATPAGPDTAPAVGVASVAPAAPPAAAPAPLAAPQPAPEVVALDHPTVVDTATLKTADKVVGLYGIVGIKGDASQGLQSYLSAPSDAHLTCQSQTGPEFVCLTPDGTDVAEVSLLNGAARAKEDAPLAYHEQEASAQAARRGIWSSLPPPPVVLQHPQVVDTATLAAGGQTYLLDGIQGLNGAYASQFQGYIGGAGDSVSCEAEANPGHFICVLPDGTDIAKVALVNGAAQVTQDAPDSYRIQQLDAINNHRGIWVTPPSDALMATLVVAPTDCCVLVAGDDGTDGITYVGGEPTAIIDGSVVFLTFAGVAGWGYYDGSHQWHDAPDRYRNHLERFHPDAHGLRGYRDGVLAHSAPGHAGAYAHAGAYGHGEPGRGALVGRGEPGRGEPGRFDPGRAGAGRVDAGRGVPGRAEPGPGRAEPGRPGGAIAAGHPGPAAGHQVAMNNARPGGGGGFVRPAPAAGGFHPAAAARPAAPAPHPAAAAPRHK